MVPLEFWTFHDVIFKVYKSVEQGKLSKIVVNLLNNLQAKGGKSHMKETGTLVRNQELNAGLKVTNLEVAQASFDP